MPKEMTHMQVNNLKQKLQDLTILYVEDDDAVRQQISEFLQRYVKTLIEVSNAEDALVRYGDIAPDILLLDVNLPGMSGLVLAQKIRQNHRDVRIIISTAYTDQDFLLQAVELELTRYLVKPVVGTDLLEALEKAVDESEAYGYTKHHYIVLHNGYKYDSHRKVLLFLEKNVLLRRKEQVLLEYFLTHAEQIISYEMLEYEVWEESTMSRDAIRAQIRNLRQKTYPQLIENIPAIGYRLSLKEMS